jgi:hypothetical protein
MLLPGALAGKILILLKTSLLESDSVSLDQSRYFTLTEAIVLKECFSAKFSYTTITSSDMKSTKAADRVSAARHNTNSAMEKVKTFKKLTG